MLCSLTKTRTSESLSRYVGKEFTRTASMSSSDSMKASLTTPKPTLDAGAFRSIPLEFCGVFWNQLGSGRSIEIRAFGINQCARRADKPAQSAAQATQANDKQLGLPATVDFRSFRTMHSSLMSSVGVRPEVTRDNMRHATIDVTQNVYNKTWWEERVEAVSMAAATVWHGGSSCPHRKHLRQCKSFCGSPCFSPTRRVSAST